MIFAEKISNVKLKKDYTELLFFVDENDNEEGYNPGTICALRIDHESEIFNMTDNKTLTSFIHRIINSIIFII